MNTAVLTIVMVGIIFLLLFLDVPVGFALSAVGLGFLFLINGPNSLYMVASTSWSSWTQFTLITIPLFVLMAAFLEKSGVAEDLYDCIYKWFGGTPGGLAIGTVIICTIFAAMSGSSSLGTLSMGVIAMPSMLKRKYDDKMVIGSIAAGGTMGILIPPSIGMIYYGYLAGVSVGKLFIGGILPGILLAVAFIIYIRIKCKINPLAGPAIPKNERFTMKEKMKALKAAILPVLLILIILGSIYTGICTATEAAGIGALGALLCTIIYKKFSLKLVKEALISTVKMTAMVGWLTLGASLFSQAYVSLGASKLVITTLQAFGTEHRWLILIGTQIILLVLGCFMDGLGIMIITIPLFVPLITSLGFNPLWYGILYTINMEIAYLTPPFGLNLFYMRMLTPQSTKMTRIYKACLPFMLLMVLVLILVMLFPEIATWLPGLMKG